MTDEPKRPRDPNQLAKMVADLATGAAVDKLPPSPSAQHARAGAMGGHVRSDRLSAERRAQIAKDAATRRWAKTAAPSEED